MMIVKRCWYSYRNYCRDKHWEGWFLLGIIPLYIRSKLLH